LQCSPDSVLETLPFTLHITPLSLLHSHKLDHHLYADDTQVYISLSTPDTDLSLKQFGDFLSDISEKPRELRSSGFHVLSVPRVKTHTGTRAFSVAVPTLWNSLSEHVKSSNSMVSFHHNLKTHLFRLAYPSYVSLPSEHR